MTTSNAVVARPVTAAVNSEIRSLGDLTEHQATTAALAKSLAQKIDQTQSSKTGAIALAVGSLIKELRSTMDELRSPSTDAANSDLVRFLMEDES
jgi:hypothetical protein